MTDFAKEVLKINLKDELRKSYLDYAMSVIIGRALPDLRDGMKPVHRRILYAMYELSNSWNRPYKKSARVVGDVIGKYHPHGDNSVYDALVRMAQDFSMRYPLVDGQGNFGSVDGDSPAAMRYTEVRMARIAHLMLEGLDQDTVEMLPNYDGNETMPEVMPALLPNLLINGGAGIAVGMATNIPPHNLTEVCNACLLLLDSPEATVEQLMEHVIAPDFPTGGYIMGLAGIRDAYRTGRGQLHIRSKAEVLETKNGREQIVVTEIPFQVNKARMIERIAELVRDKKLQGIAEIRDESDKDGLRVVIDIKRAEMGDVVLNNLWAQSQLETSFGINMVALDRGRPKLLNLKQLLVGYLGHRRTVVIRRTRFELSKARMRGHVLEGLSIALANIDPVIEAIRQSMDQEEAMQKLTGRDWQVGEVAPMLERAGADACRPDDMEEDYGVRLTKAPTAVADSSQYRLSSRQAKAILELRLHRLTGLEQEELRKEYGEILDRIIELVGILQDPDKLRAVIRGEIEGMRDQFGDERRTELREDRRDLSAADFITPEDRILTISRVGYTKAQPVTEYRAQHRGGVGKSATAVKEDDVVAHMLVANTHDSILFFTNKGRVYRLKLYEIPVAERGARGRPIVNFLPLEEGEQVSSVLSMADSERYSHVFMATALGKVKRTPMKDFALIQRKGKIAIKLLPGDELIGTSLSSGEGDILLGTNSGQVIRFPESQVRSMGRVASGVRGMKLRLKEERVIALIVPQEDSQLCFVSSGGFGKRVEIEEFRGQRRGGVGIKGMDLSAKKASTTGDVVAVRRLRADDDLAIITDRGVLLRVKAKEIRRLKRTARGVRAARLRDHKLVDVVVIEKSDDDD